MTPLIDTALTVPGWFTLSLHLQELYPKAAAALDRLEAAWPVDSEAPTNVFWDPETDTFYGQGKLPDFVEKYADDAEPHWIQFAGRLPQEKTAGLQPTPLLTSLVGAALFGGLGYGAGKLLERRLPRRYFQPRPYGKWLAALGAGLGALPGAYFHSLQSRVNPAEAGWNSSFPFNQEQSKTAELQEAAEDLIEELGIEKLSYEDNSGGLYRPTIPVDQFNRVIWSDPQTPVPIRSAAAGLTVATSLRERSPVISPMDIAKTVVGAGSGLFSATVVGKTLGALAGLSPEAQQKLQQVGIWPGILKNVIPMVF